MHYFSSPENPHPPRTMLHIVLVTLQPIHPIPLPIPYTLTPGWHQHLPLARTSPRRDPISLTHRQNCSSPNYQLHQIACNPILIPIISDFVNLLLQFNAFSTPVIEYSSHSRQIHPHHIILSHFPDTQSRYSR